MVGTLGQRQTGAAGQPPVAIAINPAGLAELIEQTRHVVGARGRRQLVGGDRSLLCQQHGEAELSQALMSVDGREEHPSKPEVGEGRGPIRVVLDQHDAFASEGEALVEREWQARFRSRINDH